MQDNDSPWSRLCGLEPMSLCDWPGRVCAVLFLGGCDLRCPTCHNAPLAWDPPAAPLLSRNQVLNHLRRRAPWLDGVTVTGGEATLSADLPAWLAELNQETGLALKLDSNGMHPDVLEQALKIAALELVAVDIKGPWARYPELAGQRIGSEQARERLESVFDLARAHPERFCFRTTLVPALTPQDLAEVRGLSPPGFTPRFQPYRAPAPAMSRQAASMQTADT
jgi:pyruvate formate lyase activating enzyme